MFPFPTLTKAVMLSADRECEYTFAYSLREAYPLPLTEERIKSLPSPY